MKKFSKLEARVMPVAIKDVDTDMIIPAQFLTSISREGYGQNLFRRLRDGDANFAINLPQYKDAKILVADSNFGCGSSREHAVWALMGAGFEVVIAKSFADIFFGNSMKSGLVLVTLKPETVDRILNDARVPGYAVEVDLEKQTVTQPDGTTEKFEFDPFRRHCILNGLDDIDYINSHACDIARFREAQAPVRYFSTTEANN